MIAIKDRLVKDSEGSCECGLRDLGVFMWVWYHNGINIAYLNPQWDKLNEALLKNKLLATMELEWSENDCVSLIVNVSNHGSLPMHKKKEKKREAHSRLCF